jgi:alpha-tubulin suppressor-like RCC1 family protein
LQKNVVAFGTGRHDLGVALTADGRVWTWGEALGRETRPIPPLQMLSKVLNRMGIGVRWGDPHRVILKRPALLEIENF